MHKHTIASSSMMNMYSAIKKFVLNLFVVHQITVQSLLIMCSTGGRAKLKLTNVHTANLNKEISVYGLCSSKMVYMLYMLLYCMFGTLAWSNKS